SGPLVRCPGAPLREAITVRRYRLPTAVFMAGLGLLGASRWASGQDSPRAAPPPAPVQAAPDLPPLPEPVAPPPPAPPLRTAAPPRPPAKTVAPAAPAAKTAAPGSFPGAADAGSAPVPAAPKAS